MQGLEDNRFAIINKTHHSLVDGVSGVDLTTVLFDTSPTPTPVAAASLDAEVEPSDATLVAEGVKELAGMPVPLARRALGAAQRPQRGRGRGARVRRGARRHRLEADQPAAEDAVERADRPAPARALAAVSAR